MTYEQVVRDIESRGVMPDTTPSLEPMKIALNRLLSPSQLKPSQTIVVAGTNGKGSVCATLEALFLSAGESVGLYTSPHLKDTTERIRINGKDIDRELFCLSYQRVIEKTQGQKLTHFEILTLMAAWVFFSGEAIPAVSRPVFEVGLGGTWDATNAIPHENCVITSLGLDHQNLLGNTLPEIASNKFGIIGSKALVVHSPLPQEVQALAHQVQVATQSQWKSCTPYPLHVTAKNRQPEFILKTPWGEAPLALPGNRAAQNTTTALTLFEALGYSPKDHLNALSQVRWLGRMHRLDTADCPCPVYLSGDHNPDGIQSLLEILPHYPRKHLYILVGIGKDKDHNGILAPLLNLKDTSVYLTQTPFRGRSLKDYGHWVDQAQGTFETASEGLCKIFSLAKEEDLVLVTGSLYLVGQVLAEPYHGDSLPQAF